VRRTTIHRLTIETSSSGESDTSARAAKIFSESHAPSAPLQWFFKTIAATPGGHRLAERR